MAVPSKSWVHSPNGLQYAEDVAGKTEKATLVDADAFAIADSASSNVQKKTLWSTIKSALKTYFDTLYAPKIVIDAESTTKTIETAANNTEYRLGTLTLLTVTAYETDAEFLIVFTTNASGCTVTLPEGTKWPQGEEPTWEAGKVYELSVKSGRAKAEWFE